jgi:hypothetical protein
MYDSSDQEAQYDTTGPKLRAVSQIRHLAGLRFKAVYKVMTQQFEVANELSFRMLSVTSI